jgi:hypothetical protein
MNKCDIDDVEVLPDDFTQYDLSFKIIVIGDSGILYFKIKKELENHV